MDKKDFAAVVKLKDLGMGDDLGLGLTASQELLQGACMAWLSWVGIVPPREGWLVV